MQRDMTVSCPVRTLVIALQIDGRVGDGQCTLQIRLKRIH